MSKEICDLCKTEGDILIRPCATTGCNAKMHPQCLEKRYVSGKKSCNKCEFPIAVKQTTTFDWIKCSKVYFCFIYTFLIIVGGTFYNIMTAMGDSPLNPSKWDRRGCYEWKEGINPHMCDRHSSVVIILSFALSLMFWQFPMCSEANPKTNKKEICWRYNIFCCIKPYKNDKFGSYTTMLIMFMISNIIIKITHIVGQYALNDYSTYTWKTFGNGIIVYFWVLLYVSISMICIMIPYVLFKGTIERFTLKKTIFGEPLKKLKPMPNNAETL